MYDYNKIWGFEWRFTWKDISYSQIDLDMDDVKFELEPSDMDENMNLVVFDFPALKYWEFKARETIDSWWFWSDSMVEFKIEDFDIDFSCHLKVDDQGYLEPVVKDVGIDFGKTTYTHDNIIVQFAAHQILELSVVIVENSAWFFGEYLFSAVLGPVTTEWLNHYKMPLKLKGWAQNDLHDNFMIDYRNTADPEITEDFITFSFMGELLYPDAEGKYERCSDLSPRMVRPLMSDFSQLVITDAAATCIAEAVQQSKLGKFILNEHTLNELLGTEGLKWDTTHLKQKIPILAEKIGDDVPLEFELSYRDMKIEIPYERNDIDVHAGFVLRVIMRYDEKDPRFKQMGLEQTELFYDELKLITKYDLDIQEDVLMVELKALQFDIDKRYGSRDFPMRNSLDFTTDEYKELLGQT